MLNQSENYKSSLNLPTTSMPIHCRLPELERMLLNRWEKMNLYSRLKVEQGRDGLSSSQFILHDGPPYANGPLHVGHALNKCLKDFILKSKRLSGYNAQFLPGWDCHGLPIELRAEEMMALKQTELSEYEFRSACRKYAETQVLQQKKAFVRFGIFGQWEQPYKTMDFKTQANTIRALAGLYKEDHLKRGTLPIYWCLECQSAISDSEVTYVQKVETGLYVRFVALDQNALELIFKYHCTARISALIWTTTPWTLPANEAIAINPNLIYQLIHTRVDNDYLLLAKECAQNVLKINDIKEYDLIGECQGSELLNLKFCHPFLAKSVAMIGSGHVTASSGTGLVHIAPAHGPEDFELAAEWDLPVKNAVDFQGNFPVDHPIFASESLQSVWPSILEILQETKSLYAQAPCDHRVACCWRHGAQLIYFTTPQWFISMEKNGLRSKALAALDSVHWQMPWGKERMRQLLETRPDWCISRQRQWGNPLPLFIHKETKKLHPRTHELMLLVAEKVESEGAEIWWELPVKAFLGDEAQQYEKEESVLDVWLDSGLTHSSLMPHEALSFPADIYFEGNDQYRGWFMSSLLTSIGLNQTPPYRSVLSHGLTVDEQGQKMSKSLGNVLDPMQITETRGADILRLWAANCDYRKEVSISEEILAQSQELHRRIRNTLRFLLSNLSDFCFEEDSVPNHELTAIDQWILTHAVELDEFIKKSYENYTFQPICKALMNFCSIDLGSVYFTIIKDRLYVTHAQSRARRSAQTALYHLLQVAVRWISPILSFTAEEIWDHLPAKDSESVFLSRWWDLPIFREEELKLSKKEWEAMFQLRLWVFLELDKFRQRHAIRSTLDLELTLSGSKSFHDRWTPYLDELAFFFSVSRVKLLQPSEMGGSGTGETWNEDHAADIINIGEVSEVRCQRCWLKVVPPGQENCLCSRCSKILQEGAQLESGWFV